MGRENGSAGEREVVVQRKSEERGGGREAVVDGERENGNAEGEEGGRGEEE